MADPGGHWCHDIGSTPRPLLFKPQANGAVFGVGYSGPNVDGGSCHTFPPSYYQGEQLASALPLTVECLVWHHYVTAAQAALVAWDYDNQLIGISVGGALPGVYVAYSSGGNVSGAAPRVYQWDHVVAVYTSSGTTIYVNGVSAAGAASAVSGTRGVFIGRTQANGQPWQGNIAEVALYNIALSSARVAAHLAQVSSSTILPVYSGQASQQPYTNAGYTGGQQVILQGLTRQWSNTP
jgi:Concanavalin A-like lectin/glucanases superfamily